jgi:hypothetical protein
MIVALTLSLALSQVSPTVGVVISSKRPQADDYPKKVAEYVYALLKLEEVPALTDTETRAALKKAQAPEPKNCQGGQLCLMKLAGVMPGESVLVGVDVARLQDKLILHLEAVSGASNESLALFDKEVPTRNWSEEASSSLTEFVRQLKTKMRAKQTVDSPPVAASDVPKETRVAEVEKKPELTPTRLPNETELDQAVSTDASPKVLPWVFTGAAVASAGTAVLFGVLGAQDKAKYESNLIETPEGLGTRLSQAEAQSLAQSANTKTGVAVGAAIGSAVLGGLATYFFLK